MAEVFGRDARGAALCAGVQRMQSLCSGYRGEAPCWGQGAKPIGGLRAAVLIGSRVKRLAQLELTLASIRTGYYLTQEPADSAAKLPFPQREN